MTKLQIWAAEGIRSGAIEELKGEVERRAFDRWKMGGEVSDHDQRREYTAMVGLIQMLENAGSS